MRIFCFGYGYVAQNLQNNLPPGANIVTTSRTPDKINPSSSDQFQIIDFYNSKQISKELKAADILLSTIPPNQSQDDIDPVLDHYKALIEQNHFLWVCYLSATSVYGHQNGAWIDENTPTTPSSEFGKARLAAEQAWQALQQPWHIFRIAGIYGPKRSSFERLENHTARCLYKEGVVFNRIHIGDLVQLLFLSMQTPTPQHIYNIADQHPCPQHEVTQFAAQLLNLTPPPLESIDDKNITVSSRMKAFFSENKRVNAKKILNALGYQLKFPSYREGLKLIFNLKK